jgi:hypothetical protein
MEKVETVHVGRLIYRVDPIMSTYQTNGFQIYNIGSYLHVNSNTYVLLAQKC